MKIGFDKKHMNIAKLLTITTLGVAFFAEKAYASEHPGKELHESANCMKCHAAKPYDPAKTTTYDKLVKKVASCNTNLHIGLFDDEVVEVAEYLNATYYHHPK